MEEQTLRKYFGLTGKNAVITGGASGLGKSITEEFLKLGVQVVIADIQSPAEMPLDEIRKECQLGDNENRLWGFQSDVRKRKEVRKMKEFSLDKLGHIDILVNNAGTLFRKGALEFTDEDWEKIIDINLTGTFLCSQEVGEHMVERKDGKIVNISSLAGVVGSSRSLPYCASKGGVNQITRSLAKEWGEYNVNVNAIAPHYFKNGATKETWRDGKTLEEVNSKIPLGRIGRTSDIVPAVVYFSSKASDWVTGQVLVLDGGKAV